MKLTRETTIRRDANGRWFHDGEPVENDAVRRAFDRWIDRAEDGRYCLKNEVNWAYVEIEGSPLFVLAAEIDAAGEVWLDLSDGNREKLDPETLKQDAEGLLFCDAREGRLEAKFTTAAAVALAPILDEDEEGLYLVIAGHRIHPS